MLIVMQNLIHFLTHSNSIRNVVILDFICNFDHRKVIWGTVTYPDAIMLNNYYFII
jgi:hypothetical protein